MTKGYKLSNETKKRMNAARKRFGIKPLGWLGKKRGPMSELEAKVQEIINKYNLPYRYVGNSQFLIESSRMSEQYISNTLKGGG